MFLMLAIHSDRNHSERLESKAHGAQEAGCIGTCMSIPGTAQRSHPAAQ
jgi:hypothetical protein